MRNSLRKMASLMLSRTPRVKWVLRRLLRLPNAPPASAAPADATRHEKIFTRRYGFRGLKDPKQGSYSGPGSTVERTVAIREAIPQLLVELDCKTLVDAPCGDFKWMQHIDLPVDQYIGVDVIRGLIEVNRIHFANEQRSFVHLDLVEQTLPKADLVLNRDMLIHLSFGDIAKFVRLLKASGCRYLLTSHFPMQAANHDIDTGDWRPVNLEIAPFGFPAPKLTISERYTANPEHADKCLALWDIRDIPLFDPPV